MAGVDGTEILCHLPAMRVLMPPSACVGIGAPPTAPARALLAARSRSTLDGPQHTGVLLGALQYMACPASAHPDRRAEILW